MPVPVLGGVAIVVTFYAVILVHLVPVDVLPVEQYAQRLLAFLGEDSRFKVGGILGGAFLIFLVGVVDDFKALQPSVKMLGQVAAAGVLILSDIRLELFVLPYWLSAAVTLFWVLLIVNAMNFLDNMDGLCGGVAVIAALSFFLGVQAHDQQLVRLITMVFAGAVAGFLLHNFPPARIFMGDAGSMFCGYLLATIALLGTFHVQTTPSPIAVAAPVLALSVPLFDICTVVFIRWRAGVPVWQGDHRHFSHRLVQLGMTRRRAVEFIWLVAVVVGLGSALLPLLNPFGTLIILAQTLGVFLLIGLLMNAGKRDKGASS
ncbi:MAG: undecaprenyl/decaprenyl-phosphate alpha-N-acetylglucosaminyl 1-phosphate transferase [Candidatus Hydrogenedentes bacterium]|nr:undecaprenyl/decaprenyl-phosphate alpha-N-acetylglucosaminyl 1-phosphate transferase [Candidatus Hydrogenedentota bacterium]